MLRRRTLSASCVAIFSTAGLLAALATGRAGAEAAPIFLDGFFTDWTGPVEHTDPAGDGVAGGIDIRALDLANDADNLFMRFELTAEIGLQSTNNLVLYLDTDQNSATGSVVSGIGAELKWQFGAKQGTFYRTTGTWTVYQDDIRLRTLPSVASPVFEISLGRDVRPDGTRLLFPGAGMRVLLRHEVTGGDQAPDAGQTLTYLFDTTSVPAPDALALAKQHPADVRITTWNVVDLETSGGGWNAAATPAADRVLSALDPDVLAFEEIYDNDAATTAALIEGFLPSGPGEAWYARENTDVKVVSRFPVLGQWDLNGTAGDRNMAVLLDTSVPLGRPLLLVGNHFFCCTNDAGRQAECDRLMSFLRDAKSPGDYVDVPFGTMILITGDLNLVGASQQVRTLTTGDIVNNLNFGADFGPDWDGSPLADLVSRQTERRFAYTYRSDSGTFTPGRLDCFIYSDSVVTVGNHFIVYTPEMSALQLALYGLQAGDVTAVSDHLPHTADFRPRVPVDVGGTPGTDATRPRAWARVHAAASAPGRARLQLALDRPARVSLCVYDVRGALVAVLHEDAAGELAAGQYPFDWDGRTVIGSRAASGTYVARLEARAAGQVLATSAKLILVR